MTDTPGAELMPSPAHQQRTDAMNLARALARSEAIPKRYWGRPDDVFATILHGDEMGLSPSIALTNIYMIEGTPTFSARFVMAIMLRRGLVQFRERTHERVTVYGRRSNGTHLEVTWTIDDAKRAELAAKQTWKRYPRQMLTARAITELGRTLFADDVVLGSAYTPEELGAVGPYDVIDIDDSWADALGAPADDDDIDERPAHEIAADMLDAEDALDAELLREAGLEDEGGA